jgi:5-methylcytosine-specific restriction enzyme subunit McrC
VFDYGGKMKLWALPFDLENECLLEAEVAGVPLVL